MAACDNLYGKKKHWQELRDFLKKKKPQYLVYMRNKPISKREQRICYIADIQYYLVNKCRLRWVIKALRGNFFMQSMICGTPHHKR